MTRTTLALMLAAAAILGAATASATSVHADAQPALDRQLVERLVRAQEQQAHALEDIARQIERAGHH